MCVLVGRTGRCRALVAIALLFACPGLARATTVPYRTDGELVALADRVVHARVLSTSSEAPASDGMVFTVIRLAVLEDLTGVGTGVIEIRELGGRAGGRSVWVPGAPQFVVGQEVVLCLERANGSLRTVALAFSAFHVGTVPASGATRLDRFASEASVVGAPGADPPSRTLDELRRVVAAVKGVGSVRAAAVVDAPAPAPARVDENFTLLGGGIRWVEADSGSPIAWYRNPAAPSPLATGDTDAEIQVALSAWTNVTSARITLAFGGVRSDGGAAATGNYCSAANAGAGLITFGNVGNVVPSGVLAIGGGCFDTTGPHVVNGQTFNRFTHGYVVFNNVSGSFTATPNFTRVMTHEIGHGVGLGHTCSGNGCTTDLVVNIMFPSCCAQGAPVPPEIGPDDRAGLTFIYPEPSGPTCSFLVTPENISIPATGGEGTLTVVASAPSCGWTAVSTLQWVSVVLGASGTGNGTVTYLVRPNYGLPQRSGAIAVGGSNVGLTQAADTDLDMDTLSDAWEVQFGLDPQSAAGNAGPDGDPDGDGQTNMQEYGARTHPRGFVTRYLSEGAANTFFRTQIALLNPGGTQARVNVRIRPESVFSTSTRFLDVPAATRRTLDAPRIAASTTGPFSTIVESDELVVVDRTMSWDATGYGSHAESAIAQPSTTWYFAEGSTSGEFSLFYLLQNTGITEADISVRFLRPAPFPPVDVAYRLIPGRRLTIPVDTVLPELASTDVSAIVTSTQPIVAERAMYLNQPGQPFAAGHASAGVTAPATAWFLAEGATGSFFELFLLIANPGSTPADVEVDYMRPDGSVLTKAYAVGAQSRFTIWVDEEQFPAGSGNKPLAGDSVAMRVRTTNGVPIIVERSMWWPQPVWQEAHNEVGATQTGTRWALAEGEVGGPAGVQTYVLIANSSGSPGLAQVTVYFEDSTTALQTVPIAANSRTSVSIGNLFPGAANRRFGITVQSAPLPGSVVVPQIVVERAMYSDHNGVVWAAGTAALATRLVP